MTNTPERIEIENYMSIIKAHAVVCWEKLKKPTIYSMEDIIGEGIMIFYKAKKKYDETKGKFIAYFKHAIRMWFGTIVAKSYRSINQTATKKSDAEKGNYLTALAVSCDTFNIALEEIVELFTKREKDYILFMLSPPKNIFTQRVSLKAARKLLAKHLHITKQEETYLYKSVTAKLVLA